MEEWMERVRVGIEQFAGHRVAFVELFARNGRENVVLLGVSTLLLLIIITLVGISFSYFTRRKRRLGNVCLLIGEPGCGKSTLFYRLASPSAKVFQTVPSLQENDATLGMEWHGRKIEARVVDIPGHGRLRKSKTAQFGEQCGLIIFLIDALSFRKQMRDVADALRDVLVNSLFQEMRVPILIFCNKMDMKNAVHSGIFQLLTFFLVLFM